MCRNPNARDEVEIREKDASPALTQGLAPECFLREPREGPLAPKEPHPGARGRKHQDSREMGARAQMGFDFESCYNFH